MGHGPALLALVLKLYLVLVFTQVALCQPAQSDQPNNGTVQLKPSNSSSAPSSSSHSASSASHSSSFSPSTAAPQSSSSFSHSKKSSTSSEDSSISLPGVSLSANFTSTPLQTPTLPPYPSDFTTSPPTDTSVPTPANSEPAASQSGTTAVLASTNSTNKVPIIAGVAGSVALIILMGISVMLYRRHKRASDRREWERTHESIADAVRQVTSPAPMRSVTPYAGSGAWSHPDYISAKGSGDTVTDPFIDNPVAHTSGEFSARPAFRAVHSPTLRAVHSPTFSQAYSPYHAEDAAPFQVQDEVDSMESSIPVDTSHGSQGHAI